MGSLTSIQHAILVGSLLGDGTLRKQGSRTNALFEVNHAFKSKEYVDWKCQNFQEYVLTPPKSRLGKGVRVAYRFTTRSLPVFTDYYYRYYKDGKKFIPSDLKLDPQSLAVWFMDDGAKSRSAVYLNTQQFKQAEQYFLTGLLFKSFGINSNLNHDKQYWRIRVSTKSTQTLLKIIRPYVLQCFRYKLMDDPVTTDSKEEIQYLRKARLNNTPTPTQNPLDMVLTPNSKR